MRKNFLKTKKTSIKKKDIKGAEGCYSIGCSFYCDMLSFFFELDSIRCKKRLSEKAQREIIKKLEGCY